MIEWIVGGASGLSAAASARWTWWRRSVAGLSVLMYHKIGEPPAGSKLRRLFVSAEAFDGQMRFLKEGGYATLSFSDLDRALAQNQALPKKSVLVTFDDGYRNNYTEAFPVLERHGVKGNIFLVQGTLGAYNKWHDPESEAWLPMLRWDDLHEMDRSGLVEFGSHTMSHRNLAKIPLEEARWELEESKKRLEDGFGREIPHFAYPYGAGADDATIRELALQAGYRFDYGIAQGKTAWPWSAAGGALPRLFVQWSDTLLDFRLKLSRERSRLLGDQL